MPLSLLHHGLIGMCLIGSAQAGGVRPDRSAAAGRILQAPDIQSVHFYESLSVDDRVTVLDAGGFKLTASCKTITYTDQSYYGGYSSTSFPSSSSPSSFHHSGSSSSSPFWNGGHHSHSSTSSSHGSSPHHGGHFSSTSSSHGSHGGGGGGGDHGGKSSSTSTFSMFSPASAPTFTSTSGDNGESEAGTTSSHHGTTYTDDSAYGGSWSPYTDDHHGYHSTHSDDWYYSTDDGSYSYDFESHTEQIASLELTYTASDEDYLFGTPSYSIYPDETLLAGSYEAGESRTQIIFAGKDGGWGDSSTMQSMSGKYLSIGQSTVGVHRSWMEGMTGSSGMEGMSGSYGVGGMLDIGFPEGVDCMVAGIVQFVG